MSPKIAPRRPCTEPGATNKGVISGIGVGAVLCAPRRPLRFQTALRLLQLGQPGWLPAVPGPPQHPAPSTRGCEDPRCSAALRCRRVGFCGNLLPSHFPGAQMGHLVLSCPAPCHPGPSLAGSPLAPSLCCSPPVPLTQVDRALVVHSPRLEASLVPPGATWLTCKRDDCVLEAWALEARLQEH